MGRFGGLLAVKGNYPLVVMADLIVLSGSVAAAWGATPGWGAMVYLPGTREIKKIVDPAYDPAAINDVLPLAAAIQWYHYARRPKGLHPHVDIATDSFDLVVAAQDPLVGVDGSDWRFMRWFETHGYEIRWLYLGKLDDDVHDEVRRELDTFARNCQAAVAARILRR